MPSKPIANYPLIEAKEVQLPHHAPLIKAVQVIDATSAHIALIADDRGRIIGSLTDGDIRRALLKGCTLDSPVIEAMHPNPTVMTVRSSKQQVIQGMESAQIKQMPLLNDDGTLAGIAVYDLLTGFERVPRSNPVVIMAGGKGKRLLPITQDIPKPMVDVAGKPMLEHILAQFVRQGFSEFYLAVNYLSHIIEEYFGDGRALGCNIRYVHEPEFLGTAGALSLIEEPFREPFIVINGDILTSVDFGDLLDYHIASDALATICARQHRTEVPYGVIRLKDGMFETMVEKPVHEDLISAGIYAMDPQVLRYVAKGVPVDMPAVLLALVSAQQKVAVFPMREDWVDVGRHDDLEAIKRHFGQN
jgi:dTDP-glucose pyrophosphorylase